WPRNWRCAWKSQISGPPSTGLLKEFPSDQHAPDFRCACADFIKLGVTQQASGRVIVDVTIAAQRLYRLQGHLGGVFRRIENAARRILARRLAPVAGCCYRIGIGARGVEDHIHVGKLALHELELANRL